MARFEAGRWGSFLSPDPFLGSADVSNPQSLNRYSYVLNNPVNMVDPFGLEGGCPPGMHPDFSQDGKCVGHTHNTLVDGLGSTSGGGPVPSPGPPDPKEPKEPKEPKKPAEPKPGWCTATVHAGNTTVGLASVVGLWSVLADAGVVTAPAGVALGTVALIGGFVGGITIGIGDAGLGLGICQ